MSTSKVFYTAIILILLPLGASAQQTEQKENAPSPSINDLHEEIYTEVDVSESNEKLTSISEYLETDTIPKRVARLAKESLLEDATLYA